jgi:hypothetical protein
MKTERFKYTLAKYAQLWWADLVYKLFNLYYIMILFHQLFRLCTTEWEVDYALFMSYLDGNACGLLSGTAYLFMIKFVMPAIGLGVCLLGMHGKANPHNTSCTN